MPSVCAGAPGCIREPARLCRVAGVLAGLCYGLVAAAMRWLLKPVREGCVSAARGASRMCSRGGGVGPFLAQWPARALDAIDGQASEASLGDLAGQAVRGMEVGSGEELGFADRVGVAVLAVGQVLLQDRPEDLVIEPARV